MIKVTPEAARQIRQAAAQSGAENLALRIAAKRVPDGSIHYGLGFDAERANDLQVLCEGVTLLISSHSRDLLNGTVLDFVELQPGKFEFIFINPNERDAASVDEGAQRDQRGCCGGEGSA